MECALRLKLRKFNSQLCVNGRESRVYERLNLLYSRVCSVAYHQG